MVVSRQGGRERLRGERGNSGISKRSVSFATMPSANGNKHRTESFFPSRFLRKRSFFVCTYIPPGGRNPTSRASLSLTRQLHTFEMDPILFAPHGLQCTTGGPTLEAAALYCITFGVHVPRSARVTTKEFPIIKLGEASPRKDTPQRHPL